MKLFKGKRIGKVSKVIAPGYGGCFKCHTSWVFVSGHVTDYREGSGCFPLCQQCWSELTPATRLPYYRELYEQWRTSIGGAGLNGTPWPVLWEQMHRAVMYEPRKEILDALWSSYASKWYKTIEK